MSDRAALSLSDFYRDVRELAEPVDVKVQGKVLGTYYPVGSYPDAMTLAPVSLSSYQPLHREPTGGALVKTIATQERTAAAQRRRDDWLKKLASPPRERK